MRNSWMGQVAWTACLAATLSCGGGPTACSGDVRTVDVARNDPLRDLAQKQLDDLEAMGYTCKSEPLRDAFGNLVGTRYTCTIGC